MKSLLWELPISELQSLQIKLEHEKIVDDLCIEGMNHLINCLDHYLDEKSNVSESEDIYLKIYATGILSNNEIIYATSKFHGHARFSDVAIAMEDADYLTDDGICYGKVNLYKFTYYFIYFFVLLINEIIYIAGINVSRNFISSKPSYLTYRTSTLV